MFLTRSLAFTPTTMSPVILFAAFVLITDDALDATRTFTAMSLLYILSSPLMMLFQLFPNPVAARVFRIDIDSAIDHDPTYIALVFPMLLLLFYYVQNFYLRTSRQLRLMDLEAKSPFFSHFLATSSGLGTIRAFGWVRANRELNYRLLDSVQQPAYLLAMIQRWLSLVLDLLVASLGMTVVVLAVTLRADSGFTNVTLVNLMSLNMMLKHVIMNWTTVKTSVGAVSRVKSFH